MSLVQPESRRGPTTWGVPDDPAPRALLLVPPSAPGDCSLGLCRRLPRHALTRPTFDSRTRRGSHWRPCERLRAHCSDRRDSRPPRAAVLPGALARSEPDSLAGRRTPSREDCRLLRADLPDRQRTTPHGPAPHRADHVRATRSPQRSWAKLNPPVTRCALCRSGHRLRLGQRPDQGSSGRRDAASHPRRLMGGDHGRDGERNRTPASRRACAARPWARDNPARVLRRATRPPRRATRRDHPRRHRRSGRPDRRSRRRLQPHPRAVRNPRRLPSAE